MVNHLLDNPVYHALLSGDARLGNGSGSVRFFDEAVSPFVGFDEGNANGFDELHELLPSGRKILYATRHFITQPKGWELMHEIEGLQFVFDGRTVTSNNQCTLQPLSTEHVPEMLQLTALTKPGPFNTRTIEFGHYFGIFEDGRLAAMTGQRLHVNNYTEVSAVCTHPDFLGKGYAGALMQHVMHIILNNGQIPFLHVRADNSRAIALYERLGFKENGPMNFYFMKRA
jgi:GNAT superfamily N-acetyltransferase